MFKLTFKQQVLTGFAVSLTFVLISAVSSYLSIKKLNENAAWQAHTYEVIDKITETEVYVLNSETGFRGYILTQRDKYLTPYTQNVKKITPTIRGLKLLVNDNPSQVSNTDSLSHYADLKIADMEHVISVNRTQGQGAAIKVILTEKGKYFKDQILKISQQMINNEMILLKKRKNDTISSSKQTTLIVVVSSIIIFGLILFLLSYIRRTFDQQKETEIQIRENNAKLETLSAENEQKNWLLSGAAKVNESLRGEQEMDELSNHIISSVCNYVEAPIGAIFLSNAKDKSLELTGAYAYPLKKQKEHYHLGDGLVGQVAVEKRQKLLSDVPNDYIKISSGLGHTTPKFILLTPILFENETIAVIEIGLKDAPKESTLLFLKNVAENIGVAINSALARIILRDLFEQTQQQAEELETQQEELRTTNEELLHKSEELQASEEELRVQQEELQQTNAELEEKAQLLAEKNISIEQAREAISLKAQELEISSKYKSEFLANMSHELRTPLNSILILARILKENKPDNLNDDQVKYAGVIQNAGTDLLNLINDILDLSKIESGKIDLTIEKVTPQDVKRDMEALFTEVAKNKKIKFEVDLSPQLPAHFTTDLARLEQIIKNLLSNAFKFTPEHGAVTLSLAVAKETESYSNQLNSYTNTILSIAVKDTGIGIAEDKQKVIFEAFQQADGSTSRKYGGTGLGLSISKELANILGGEIQIKSKQNIGSTFTLFIPQHLEIRPESEEFAIIEIAEKSAITFAQPLKINADKNTLLIVEDDVNFAEILKNYAIERGFNPILAHSGDIGLDMAIKNLPDAIILDIMLPVMDGWTILKKLKSNPITKHIPVHMMSAGDEKIEKAKKEGAIGFLKKPIGEDELANAFNLFAQIPDDFILNTVLLIEDQELQSKILTQQLLARSVNVTQAFTGKEALTALNKSSFDCIILDLNLPDISGFELLDKIKSQPKLQHIPVVINTAMELQKDQMAKIMHYSEAMVLKSSKSNDRLIDEVSLFMNKLKSGNKQHTTKTNTEFSEVEKSLLGKKILITDDDMRNIFALSTALQSYDMQIVIASNGREAIQMLNEIEDIDLVLMDIMMPEMDGYEAMTLIRKKKKFLTLPIIALTAKAMKSDREKCIEAGASDYISKPFDVDELLSMMRVWLSK